MALVSFSNLSKYYGENIVIESASFSVENNHKIGFVGANGSGKTTLFKILSGEIHYDSGELYISKNTKISYVDQFTKADNNKTVLEETLTVFQYLQEIEKELSLVNAKLTQSPTDELIQRQHTLSEEYQKNNGYLYQSLTISTLQGLGFSTQQLYAKISTLSGGQKTKVALAKLLLSPSNLLLLDEPTNHLDIESIEWLENYLLNYKGSFIVISHDRYFLDKVTTETLEIENHILTSYPGNYSKYLILKEEKTETLSKKYDSDQKEIKRLENMIQKQIIFGQEKNYKTVHSKEKSIERIENQMQKPPAKQDSISFHFDMISGGNLEVIKGSDFSKSFGDLILFQNASFTVLKKDHAFLLGPNGSGKTTLLNMVMQEESLDKGEIVVGSNIKIAYYKQASSLLASSKTVLEYAWNLSPTLTETQIRSALAKFLFKGEDVFKVVSTLSGGEKARLSLLEIMLSKSNMLILDEPTNHLDIPSREALEQALLDYEGTLLVVSHDRYFINKLASKIFSIENYQIKELPGNYENYLSSRHIEEETTPLSPSEKTGKQSYLEKKEREASERKIKNRIAKIEQEIGSLTKELEDVRAKTEEPENISNYQKLVELNEQIAQTEAKIDALYQEWETLI